MLHNYSITKNGDKNGKIKIKNWHNWLVVEMSTALLNTNKCSATPIWFSDTLDVCFKTPYIHSRYY